MLAWLRAHYPEHQQQGREEEDREKRRTSDETAHPHTPAVIPQSTTHNTMRQDKTCTAITQHTETRTTMRLVCKRRIPPHLPTHNKHDNTKQKRNENDTREQDNVKGDRTMQGARPNPKTGNTAKRTGITRDTGTTQQHTTPRHSTGPPHKQKGDANTQTGDTDIRRGVSNTAALHSPCHPPSAMPPHHP